MERNLFLISALIVVLLLAASGPIAQTKVPTAPHTKTIFRDSDGNLVSNNEFVDIRMANFHYPDATLIKTLDDATIEFRLQKIPQEGMAAPNFSAKTIDGKTIKYNDLKGKVVVLNFWFIGCPVCFAQRPKLNEFAAKFAGNEDVVFVAMTADPSSAVKKYIATKPFDYHQVADAKPAMDKFVFAGFPKNIIIGKDGKIVYWRTTIHAWDKFESVVRTELGKK